MMQVNSKGSDPKVSMPLSDSGKFLVDGISADCDKVRAVSQRSFTKIGLAPEAVARMLDSRKYIEAKMATGATMYGVNTGFGAFATVRIDDHQIEELQRNLIRSHAVGIGEYFSREQVRAIMYLRANALATGNSGIRPEVVLKIIEFLNHDIIPAIPQQGSVGASGDLAPLAHLALALIGEGEVLDQAGAAVSVEPRLRELGVAPLGLRAKEGLSIINGCQVMTAVGMIALDRAKSLCVLTDLSAAMSLEALRGSRAAFDPLISSVRRHPGESETARNIVKILTPSSGISESHINCNRVQDAYSIRCVPAVHGAAKIPFFDRFKPSR
jgi:histidine ammonia-lyase